MIIVMFDLNYKRFRDDMSTSSISIIPSTVSIILKRLRVSVDFPAPVLPTIPIFSIGLMVREKFWRAGFKSFL